MKRIGVLSDTHGYLDPRVFHHFEHCDEIWHAGDIGSLAVLDALAQFKPTRVVWGNIDDAQMRRACKEIELFEVEGARIAMLHIAGKADKPNGKAWELIRNHRPQILVCGHSHILLVKYRQQEQLLWMNPGACGIKGFHKVRTLLRFEIHLGKVQNLEVIELADRYPESVLESEN